MNKTELQAQILGEIKMGKDFIEPKREVFRDRLVKYIDQDKDADKI